MTQVVRTEHTSLDGPPGPSRAFRDWLALAVGLLAILAFMFLIAPIGLKLPGYTHLTAVLEETGIPAPALFYTGVPQVGDAEIRIRDSLTYAPAKP
jgi:hypothetical protein